MPTQVLVFRCANGIVVWDKKDTLTPSGGHWLCLRDQFTIQSPSSDEQVEQTLLALAQHSVGLAGAIQQVVELEI